MFESTFVGILLFHHIHEYWVAKSVILGIVLVIGIFFINHDIQSNSSWNTFLADAKIALDTQTYQQWKYNGAQDYPNSELGSKVSVTNYERIAWGKTGLKLILKYPLGYGLIERSFGKLAKIYWPDSQLHQSHSGWIDLALGLGIPGFLLIVSGLVVLLHQLSKPFIPVKGNGSSTGLFKKCSFVVAVKLGIDVDNYRTQSKNLF